MAYTMDNYIYVSDGGGLDAAQDAGMFPASSAYCIEPSGSAGVAVQFYMEPRAGDGIWEGGLTAAAYDKVELGTLFQGLIHTPDFFTVANELVARFNAHGPFTVICDMDEPKDGRDYDPGIHKLTSADIFSSD